MDIICHPSTVQSRFLKFQLCLSRIKHDFHFAWDQWASSVTYCMCEFTTMQLATTYCRATVCTTLKASAPNHQLQQSIQPDERVLLKKVEATLNMTKGLKALNEDLFNHRFKRKTAGRALRHCCINFHKPYFAAIHNHLSQKETQLLLSAASLAQHLGAPLWKCLMVDGEQGKDVL